MRVKRGLHKKKLHKKVLKQAKGYFSLRSKSYRMARQQLLHSGDYNFAHRKKRAGQFRTLWISRINAGLTESGLTYSKFIAGLKKTGIMLDRKILSYLAFNHKSAFNQLVELVGQAA